MHSYSDNLFVSIAFWELETSVNTPTRKAVLKPYSLVNAGGVAGWQQKK
ncbi:hypothetical protein AAFN90_08935 [Erwiniaceae bacterium CAU 1747]